MAMAEVELCRVHHRADVAREREALVAAKVDLAAVRLEPADGERQFSCACVIRFSIRICGGALGHTASNGRTIEDTTV